MWLQVLSNFLQAKYCPNCGSKKWDDGKPQPKIREPNVWTRAIVKDTRKGPRLYVYYMATWREGPKTVNRHLGSCEKLSLEDAKAKALRHKTDALEKFYGNPSYSSINANDRSGKGRA